MSDLNLTTGDETVSAAGRNDNRLRDLRKEVVRFGEEASLGKDSLPKLAHAVVRAAHDGIIDATTKDAKGNDAASILYAAYVSGESKKAVHEHSDGGKKANISKLRQLISMGMMTTIDPIILMDDAMKAREGMSREDGVKVKGAYPFYVDVAREQLRTDHQLTTKELEDLVKKEAPAPKELEKILENIKKSLEDLVTSNRKDGINDRDELTEAAFNCVRDRLDKIAKERAVVQLREKAVSLGLQLA